MIYKEIYNNKKKWIVLIHCVCGNEKIFNKQIDTLKEIYNIVILRLAGHEIHSKLHEATFDYVVEELHKISIAKESKINLMGVSLGAMIATKYIAKYPEDISNAYLIGNIYGFSIPLFKVGYIMLTRINKVLPRRLYMYFITKFILPSKHQKTQRNKLYKYSLKMDSKFLYAWMKEMGNFILKGKENFDLTLSNKNNIYLIYGEKDNMFLGWVKKRIKDEQRSILNIIKDAGHLCNIDSPSDINTIIKEACNEETSYN